MTKPARWYVSRPIRLEYQDVLSRPELKIRRLRIRSEPGDDTFLECADAALADYLVTGNQQHFPMYWKRTKVITSREFIMLVAPHLLP